jgi:hypothetical protein
MKANQTPEDDRALGQVLREWKVKAPLPPRFQDGVWRRIERAERQVEPGTWARLARMLETGLLRPRFALAYLAVLLAMGVLGGTFAAQATSRRLNADLGLRYVQSLDPYQTAGLGR